MSTLKADNVTLPKSGVVKKIVLFLHGYGSNGADLMSIAPIWQPSLPDTIFISPNAPFPMSMFGGYQWFGLERFDPDYLMKGALMAQPILEKFIDELLEKYGLQDQDLAIVGFSQGTMTALFTALQRLKPIAGVVGYSGSLLLSGAEKIKSKPPIVLIHGDMDPIVPVDASITAHNLLSSVGIDAALHRRPFLPHGIDEEGIKVGGEFLRKVLLS